MHVLIQAREAAILRTPDHDWHIEFLLHKLHLAPQLLDQRFQVVVVFCVNVPVVRDNNLRNVLVVLHIFERADFRQKAAQAVRAVVLTNSYAVTLRSNVVRKSDDNELPMYPLLYL